MPSGLSHLQSGYGRGKSGHRRYHTAPAGIAAAIPQVTGILAGTRAGMNALLACGKQVGVLAKGLSQHPDAQVIVLAEAVLAQLVGFTFWVGNYVTCN
jgi:hypothetical protein